MHYPAVGGFEVWLIQANKGHEVGSIVTVDIPFTDTWKAMEECVEMGLVRNIGVSSKHSSRLS